MFRYIANTHVSTEAVGQIVNFIRSRQLGPGDRLPSERRLAKDLGISRASVREALHSLAGTGLIEIRAGVGAFVQHPVSEFIGTALPPRLLANREILEKLFELRQIIETGAVAIAALKATPADLDLIRRAVEQMEACEAQRDLEGMVEADIELHRAILVATGNDILVHLMDNVADLLREVRRLSVSISEDVHLALESHRAILQALEQHQPEEARQAMLVHLQNVAKKVTSVETLETGQTV